MLLMLRSRPALVPLRCLGRVGGSILALFVTMRMSELAHHRERLKYTREVEYGPSHV